jgi:hypothetical protein
MKEKYTHLWELVDAINRRIGDCSAYIDGSTYHIGNVETGDIDLAIAYATEVLARKGILV